MFNFKTDNMKKFVFIMTVILSIVSTASAQDFKNVWVYANAPETIGKYSPDYVPSGEGLTIEINANSITMFGTTYLTKRTSKDRFGKKFEYELINENDSDRVFNLIMIRTDYNRFNLQFSKEGNTISFDAWKTTSAKNIRVKQYSESKYDKTTKTWSDWSKPKKYKSLVTLYENEIMFSNKTHDEYRTYSLEVRYNREFEVGVDERGIKWKEWTYNGFDILGTRITILKRVYANDEYELTFIYSKDRKIIYRTFIENL